MDDGYWPLSIVIFAAFIIISTRTGKSFILWTKVL